MHRQPSRIHQRRVQLLNPRTPNQPHIHLHLILQQLHRPLHARLAIRTHRIQKRPTNPHPLSAQAQRLDNIRRPPNPSIDVDFYPVRPPARMQRGHHLRQNLDGGARKVELAAAVVGEDDGLDAVFDCFEDVFDALDALEDDGHGGYGLEPGDVGPGEGWVDEGGDGAGGALGAVDVAAALLYVGAYVGEFGAHVLFAAAELGGVDGDEEALAAAGFGMLDDALGDGAVFVDVELEPLGLVAGAGVDDFVKGAAGEGGDHLDDVVGARAAGEADFAFWVAEFAKGGGGDVEGDGDWGAEHGCGHVDFFDVDEDAGAEPDLVEGGVVFSEGLLSIELAMKISLDINEREGRDSIRSHRPHHWNNKPKPSSSSPALQPPRNPTD